MKNLWFLRHGETDENLKHVYFGRRDPPLNSHGIHQMEVLRSAVEKISFDAVYSSPLKRCIESAKILVPEQHIHLHEGLLEMDFGAWEGCHYEECLQEYPEEFLLWSTDYKTHGPPGGENFMSFWQRVQSFIEEVDQKEDANILVIAHEGVLKLLTSLLLTRGDSLFWHLQFIRGTYSLLKEEQGHYVLATLNRGGKE